MSEDTDLSTLLAVLDDEYARDILTHTSVEPMSASTLSERCDASLPTIYRRLDRLEECHLVTEETEIAPDGNHYSVYSANLDRLELSLENGSFSLELTYSDEDVADTFTRMWEGDAMSRNVVRIDEATMFELLTVASLFLVALFGALIAYQAYRGYRRNDARSMLYLALGLLLLTVFPFLLNVGVTTLIDPERVVIALLENVSRLFGLLAITYSLYGHH